MSSMTSHKTIGDICLVLNGFAFKSQNYVDSGYRVIRISNVQKGRVIDEAPKYYPFDLMLSLGQYILKENDLLMSLTGNVGRVGLLTKDLLPAALNQRVACLRLKDDSVLLKYLFYYLNSDRFEEEAIHSASGIAQKNMSTEWLKGVSLPVPSMEVQGDIVAELDVISHLIENKQKQLNDLDSLSHSLYYETFGNPVNNSKNWPVLSIGELCEEVKYGTSRPGGPEGQYKYLRMNNLTSDGYFDLSDIKYIDLSGVELDKCLVHKGDILFNRTNSLDLVGKTALFDYEEDMVIAGYLIRVRVNESIINPNFLVRHMNLPSSKAILKTMAKGAVNQANINSKELQSIKVPVPPIELQCEFDEKIRSINAQKELIKLSQQEISNLFSSRIEFFFNSND